MAFTYDENIFSDLHKDARGFRPRGHEFYTATPERKQEIWDAMLVELEDEIENERRGQIVAQRRFEELVTETIAVGAGDRDTAIRWILEAEGDRRLRRGGRRGVRLLPLRDVLRAEGAVPALLRRDPRAGWQSLFRGGGIKGVDAMPACANMYE